MTLDFCDKYSVDFYKSIERAEKILVESFYENIAETILMVGCPSDSKISVNPYEIFKREITITSTFSLIYAYKEHSCYELK